MGAPGARAAASAGERHAAAGRNVETCPISTEGWTRRVHFVREGGEEGLGLHREVAQKLVPRYAQLRLALCERRHARVQLREERPKVERGLPFEPLEVRVPWVGGREKLS